MIRITASITSMKWCRNRVDGCVSRRHGSSMCGDESLYEPQPIEPGSESVFRWPPPLLFLRDQQARLGYVRFVGNHDSRANYLVCRLLFRGVGEGGAGHGGRVRCGGGDHRGRDRHGARTLHGGGSDDAIRWRWCERRSLPSPAQVGLG